MKSMMENKPRLERYLYGNNKVRFFGLPPIRLVSFLEGQDDMPPNDGSASEVQSSWLDRFARATRRREFTLAADWSIEVACQKLDDRFNGHINVPAHRPEKTQGSEEKLIVFDGASVPVPWLISLLSIGVLRPLGVMLTASIVHDYAFRFGHILISKAEDGPFKKQTIERSEADKLFREILVTVNRLPIIATIAWFAVRLGWFAGVRFNGARFRGRMPVGALMVFLMGVTTFGIYLCGPWSSTLFERMLALLIGLLVPYVTLYGLSVWRLKRLRRNGA